MSKAREHEPSELGRHRYYALDRLVMLSDGVFAIAMTLLALELRPPAGWDGTAKSLWERTKGSLLAYGFSFLVVASYWVSHRSNFRRLAKTDRVLTTLSLLGLGLVTLLPAVTRLVMEHGRSRAALAVYLISIAAVGVANALVWGYASIRPGLMDPAPPPRYRLMRFLILLGAPLPVCTIVYFGSAGQGPWIWVFMTVFYIAIVIARRMGGPEELKAAVAGTSERSHK